MNSVLDADSNKTVMKKICPKLCSGKGMASLHNCSRKLSNIVKYMILLDLSKFINRYVDI
jgi:hypothetical protein